MADNKAKRFVQRPPPRTGIPHLGNIGLDGASYQEFFQSLYDAGLITGANGEVHDVNPRAVEFFGYDARELKEMVITDLISGSDPSLIDSIRLAFEKESSVYIEAYCERKDRSLFPVEIIVNKLKHVKSGTYCFFVRDATRRKQAEETLASERNLLRTLIDALPDHIYVKNAEKKFLLDNIAHRKFVGAHSEDEVIGKSSYDLFPSNIADDLSRDEETLLQTGQPIVDQEQCHSDASHQLKWISTSKMPLFDQAGKVVGFVAIGRDVTQYKLSTEMLKTSADKLEKSNRELQEFAYIASHDLQEPLRKIQAFGDRINAKFSSSMSEEGRDYLQRMQNAAGRMQTLINNLLMLSRVTTKGQPFTKIDLNQVLMEVLSDLELRIEQVKARVETVTLPSLDADPIQIRQLLQNVIGNALKFHRTDVTPVISINFETIREPIGGDETTDAMWCCLKIQDNGIGFDEKYAEMIFAPFHRLHGREEYEGTGIGLAICRKIVERHGGTINATSSQGNGSLFTIKLPYRQKSEP